MSDKENFYQYHNTDDKKLLVIIVGVFIIGRRGGT